MVKVYVDLVWLVNFIMDFFLLWLTGKAANLPLRFWRLSGGAAWGAFYSLVIFLPELPALLSFLMKNLCALLMVGLAYPWQNMRRWGQAVLYLYGLSFTLGGAVFAAVYLGGTAQVWRGIGFLGGIHYGWLICGMVLLLAGGFGGFYALRKNWLEEQLMNKVTICFPEKQVQVTALLDTGNQLTDPLTRQPVIVVESVVLEEVLPREIMQKIKEGNWAERKLLQEGGVTWQRRIRLIPFNSVGQKNGLMVGLSPDLVVIKNKRQEIITANVVLGLVNKRLSREGRYQALLHPQVLQVH